MPAFTLTDADLRAMVDQGIQARLEQLMPASEIQRRADELLEQKMGLLTWEQAATLLQLFDRAGQPSKRAFSEFAHTYKLPVIYFTTKRWFVRRADIEATILAHRRHLPDPAALAGTRLTLVEAAA